MADTRVAPRRLPFPLGTKMIFYQATAPADWVIDNSKDDRYLRVVSGTGGSVGGPINTVTVTNPNLKHRHHLNAHTHSVGAHTHSLGSHYHNFGLYSSTVGMGSEAYHVYYDYRIKDDGLGWVNNASGTNRAYLDTDGGSGQEGHHNHFAPPTGPPHSSSTSGSATGSLSTGADSDNMGYTGDLVHTHTLDTNFRLAYADCIIAELVN